MIEQRVVFAFYRFNNSYISYVYLVLYVSFHQRQYYKIVYGCLLIYV